MALGKRSRTPSPPASAAPTPKRRKTASASRSRSPKRPALSAIEAIRQEQDDIYLTEAEFEADVLNEARSRATERRIKRKIALGLIAAHPVPLERPIRVYADVYTVEETNTIISTSSKSLDEHFLFVKGIGAKDSGVTATVSLRLPKGLLANGRSLTAADLNIVKTGEELIPHRRGNALTKGPAALETGTNLRADLKFMAFMRKIQERVKSGDLAWGIHSPAFQFSTDATMECNADPFWALWYAMPVIAGPTQNGIISACTGIGEDEEEEEESVGELPLWLVVLFWQQAIEAVTWLHTPTPSKPYMIAHGDLNEGNLMLDLQTPALPTSLAHGLLKNRPTPRATFIDFGRSCHQPIPLEQIVATKSTKQYMDEHFQSLVRLDPEEVNPALNSQREFLTHLDGDSNQMAQNLISLLNSSEAAEEFAAANIYIRDAVIEIDYSKLPPYMAVLKALKELNITEALAASKKWFEIVKTQDIEEEEVEEWFEILEESRMSLPGQEEINEAIRKHQEGKLPEHDPRGPSFGKGQGKTGGTKPLGALRLD